MRRNTFSSFNFRAADTLLELGLCSCYSSNRCKQMYSFNVVCILGSSKISNLSRESPELSQVPRIHFNFV